MRSKPLQAARGFGGDGDGGDAGDGPDDTLPPIAAQKHNLCALAIRNLL